MSSEDFRKYFGLIGAGVAALGYFGWRVLKKNGEKSITGENEPAVAPVTAETSRPASEKPAVPKPAESATEQNNRPRAIPEAEKTSLLNGIATAIKEQNTDEFTIRFGQSKKRGYRGYYLSGLTDASVFIGWSKEYESIYTMTPFWIELDSVATTRFKEIADHDRDLDIYPHPTSTDRILIAVPRGTARKSTDAAAMVLDISRATLI